MSQPESTQLTADADLYKQYGINSGVTFHLLRGQCERETDPADDDEEPRDCSNGAFARIVLAGGAYVDTCRSHVTDEELEEVEDEAAKQPSSFRLKQECDKQVKKTTSVYEGFKEGKSTFSGPERSEPCGDRAFVRVVSNDGTFKDFCYTHARRMWLRVLLSEDGGDSQ